MPQFLKVLAPILKAKAKMRHGFLFLQKLIDVLILNFKAILLALRKIRKKDFCIALAEKTAIVP